MIGELRLNFAATLAIDQLEFVNVCLLLDSSSHKHLPKGKTIEVGEALLSYTRENKGSWLRPDDDNNLFLCLDPTVMNEDVATVSHGQHQVMYAIERQLEAIGIGAVVLYAISSKYEQLVNLDSELVFTRPMEAYVFCTRGNETKVKQIVKDAIDDDTNTQLEMKIALSNEVDDMKITNCHGKVTHYKRAGENLVIVERSALQPHTETKEPARKIVKKKAPRPVEQHLFAKGKKTTLGGGRKKKPKFRMGDK